jgi:hypothetical protein
LRDCILTREICQYDNGDYDKRGLPDPLVLAFYFSAHEDKIVQLIIRRNEAEIDPTAHRRVARLRARTPSRQA